MFLRRVLQKNSSGRFVSEVKHKSPLFFRPFSFHHLPNVQKALARFTFPEQRENINKGLKKIYEKNDTTKTILDTIEREIPHNLVIEKALTLADFEYSGQNEWDVGKCFFYRFLGKGMIWISCDEIIRERTKSYQLFDPEIELSMLSILLHEATHFCDNLLEYYQYDRSLILDDKFSLALDCDFNQLKQNNHNTDYGITLINEIENIIKNYAPERFFPEWLAYFAQLTLKLSDKELLSLMPNTYQWFINDFGKELQCLNLKEPVETPRLSL